MQEHDSHPLQWLVTTTVTCAPLPVTAPGEATPHLPKADPGHWWASFFPSGLIATVLESPEQSESAPASTGMITYDLAREAAGKQQPGSQPGKTNCSPCPE